MTARDGPQTPALSSLVGRVVAARTATVSPQPTWPVTNPDRTSPTARPRFSRAVGADPARCVVLGAHGGAGVSALLRAGLAELGAVDGGRVWPDTGPVLLVARTSTSGLQHAQRLLGPDTTGGADLGRPRLLGLVLVADAPGRLPARAAQLADLLCGAVSRVWQVPWLTEWRLASRDEPLPVHPEVARLCKDLRALIGGRFTCEGERRCMCC